MRYIGLQQQISRNNLKSVLFLLAFPVLVLLANYAVLFFLSGRNIEVSNESFLKLIPNVCIMIGIWFGISYFFHTKMIQRATRSRPLNRYENMRVYNLTENLCMRVGMQMPRLYIIESDALNAFASGINEKSFSVTLTRGIIEALDDDELEGVIAHELTHIRNRDVRLLIVTIVFVGIFTTIANIALRLVLHSSNLMNSRSSSRSGGKAEAIMMAIFLAMTLVMIVSYVVYFLSMLFKLALSRSREYMADAGAVELTRNSLALASALRKISGHSEIDEVRNDEVKELFIDHKVSGFMSLFATHPPIEKRIAVLEQY